MKEQLCPIRGCGQALEGRVLCPVHWWMVPADLQHILRFESARPIGVSRAVLRAVSIVQSAVDSAEEPCGRTGCDLKARPGLAAARLCLVCYHDMNPALRRTIKMLFNKGSPISGYEDAVASAMEQLEGK